MQADGLPAELAHQENPLALRFVHGQRELVLGPSGLKAKTHLVLGPKEAVGGHGVVQTLMGAEVVVVVDEISQALLRFVQLLRAHARPKLLAHGLPKAFALAHSLWVFGARKDVLDALTVQQLAETAGAPPGVILPALVRQQLLGLAEALDAFQHRFLHKVRGLLQAQAPRDDVAAVVVHEGDQVHLLAVAGQVETGDVGLPQFAGLGALKAPGKRRLFPTLGRRASRRQGLFLHHPPDHWRAGFESFEPGQKALHLAQAKVRKLGLHLLDAFAQSRSHRSPARLATWLPAGQGLGSVRAICLHPA